MILIIDGNYLLNKNVFVLHKLKQLYGLLHKSLEKSVSNYRTWHPFEKVYFVSDKGTSWRKSIYPEYKAHRSKSNEIDWEFCYIAYEEFKQSLSKSVTLLEHDKIEGDDWVYYLINHYNKLGKSTITISNDYDIKQLLDWSFDPMYINIMVNEIMNNEKIFIPKNYNLWLNKLKESTNDDLFNLNDNNEEYRFLDTFIWKRDIIEVDKWESLLHKVVPGDKSDNIKSVFVKKNKAGKDVNIGDTISKKVWDKYITEFKIFDSINDEVIENYVDIICEVKKIDKSHFDNIKKAMYSNLNLIQLNKLPNNILSTMNNHFLNLNNL